MNKEIDFSYLGIPEEQVKKIEKHINHAKQYVYEVDPGMRISLGWLKDQLKSLSVGYVSVLFDIAVTNKPSSDVYYLEEGYDS